MFRRIFAAALGAGIGVGIAVALLQQVTLVPMILTAEIYESGAAAAHKHTQLLSPSSAGRSIVAEAAALLPAVITPAEAHDTAALQAEGDNSPWRPVLTWVATTLTSVGFALLLAGAFAVSGRNVDMREGLLWGLGGFAAFALAPAFGLPPELPGSVAADLLSRQIWWIGTAAATLTGLGFMVFVRASWAVPLALALLMAPHVIGAPHPHDGAGVVPPELAASFAARSLGVNAVFWALLGLATGALYSRFGRAQAA
jgi:cobalt transporter subunit CbtA